MLTVRKAVPQDAVLLAANLRPDDIAELNASGVPDIELTIREGIEESEECYVAVSEGDIPEIVFGVVATEDPIVGAIWMLGTPAIENNWVQVLRETRQWLNKLFGDYKLLGNAVWSGNRIHIRWLRWAGFTFLREVPVGDHVFYEFAALNLQEIT